MPELPEVETIKLELNRLVRGKQIRSVAINLAKQVKTNKAKFLRLVQGTTIKEVRRRAKLVIIELSGGYKLVFHLKMTGQLIYRGPSGRLAGGGHPIKQDLKKLPNKYSHVIFNFSDGARLFFNDTRQFGWLKLVSKNELAEIESRLGPEPLRISWQEFKQIFKHKKSVIKPLLMEAKFIAGIGNIYAAESLYCAGISPTRRASSLKEDELKKLFSCLKKILRLAISKKGTSSDSYVDALGRQGSMEKYLKVYGRKGGKCHKCGGKLKEIRQAQRATIYCSVCQT